jgi:hypothetical protein
MSFTSWLRTLRSPVAPIRVEGEHRRRAPRAAALPPRLEVLGDRCLPSFLGPVSYTAGPRPSDVVTGNFNNDTALDLAVANYYDGSVTVLPGNADGTFRPAVTSATGDYPQSLAVGDFDGDGKLDLAAITYHNYASHYDVSVLRGNGDGTFQTPDVIETLGAASMAVGDFNGDGKLDLGVLSAYGGDYYSNDTYSATVLLGNGDGSFSPPNTTVLGNTYYDSLALADFNGDGNLDFATTNHTYRSVSVLLGDGLGDFLPPTDFSTGTSGTGTVTAGDANGDGHIDLVMSNGYPFAVSVLPGDGLGSFGPAQTSPTGEQPLSPIVLGDVNRDGRVDLVLIATAVPNTSGSVSVLLGIGGGAFSAPRTFAAGSYPGAVVVGDFNGDGWLDAAATSYLDGVSVLVNDTHWVPAGAPSVTINDVSVTEGNTGTVGATFTVSLSAASGQPVTIHYAAADGTATAGSDYAGLSGDVTFDPGQTTRTITVAVNGDRLVEPTETFVVNLSDATNAAIADGQGVGTIADDEPHIRITDRTTNEGNSGLTAFAFTVSLSAAYDVPVTVHYSTADGTATAGDYQAASGTLTIPAGQTGGTITVMVNGDRLVEPNKTFFVNLSNPNYGAVADGQGFGTVLDDEPRISIGDVTRKEGNGKKTTLFTFTVTLSAAYDQAVTMSFRTADGTATTGDGDYIARTGTLTFAPGETTKTITIEVKCDHKRESDETFYLDLFDCSSYSLFTRSRGTGTILNDD